MTSIITLMLLCLVLKSVTVKSSRINFLTDDCWLKYSGVCVNRNQNCPFGKGLDSHADLCEHSTRRCCVPKKSQNKFSRRDYTCGKTPALNSILKLNNYFILEGRISLPGEWPWQISVGNDFNDFHMHQCGGSLIHPEWILTAAHCYNTKFNVRIPSKSEYIIDNDNAIDIPIKEWHVYPDYLNEGDTNKKRLQHDVALIKLSSRVNWTDYIQPACLPESGETFENMACFVTGYGGRAIQLEKVRVPLYNRDKCESRMCAEGLATVSNASICAGYKEGLRDSCQGDSGGPLICRNENADRAYQWILAGIVSFGKGCGEADYPGIYVEVSKYLDWIEWVTQEKFSTGKYIGEKNFQSFPIKMKC